jgi:magnesium chelatase family protein
MQVARTRSAVVIGVRAHIIEAQAQVTQGLPQWRIVGLPDASVSESHERVRAATLSSGLVWPSSRITVGLSPASLPKRGSGLDLAIALAVQCAGGAIPEARSRELSDWVMVGELALDGRVGAVGSVLPAAVAAREVGAARLVVPAANAREAALVPGLEVLAVTSLRHLWAVLAGDDETAESELDRYPRSSGSAQPTSAPPAPDLADVRGQSQARRALLIAAAGGHHLAMVGAAGVGKTLLATRLAPLLPDLDDEQALEVSAIRALLRPGAAVGLVRRPPVSAPHHTTTDIALIGGGAVDHPRIGLVTAAHHGVLLLDEAAEFSGAALESLRQAIESGVVQIARGGFDVELPAMFQLVLTSNTCPCGRALDTSGSPCSCSSIQRRRYRTRLSGPLLDRVDLRLTLHRPTLAELSGAAGASESTSQGAQRVAAARERSARRCAGSPWRWNARVPAAVVRASWPIPPGMQRALDDAARARESVRGLDIALRVAWTIADLDQRASPGPDDLQEALGLRSTAQWAA